ncbi:hypothetical protein [Devosia sp.]|uniref:hypothetical protein n=1 Tax=Devosia sp. TaxID=1871048 RepID=UPI0027337849|nr:hypothetical protein [Devosia sp.]MDP2781533.1 hypothetical protein [Devosia sp.]
MEELSIWLEEQSGGVRTYLEFQQKVSVLLKTDAANSALYALMGAIAQRFYQKYDGEPLPVDAANGALSELRSIVANASSSMQADAQHQLALLNELAGLELSARRISSAH